MGNLGVVVVLVVLSNCDRHCMSQDELTCSHKMMLKAVEGPMLSIIDDEETVQCYMKMSSVVTSQSMGRCNRVLCLQTALLALII